MDKEKLELERKVIWLEKRYSQMVKIMVDTVAEIVPVEKQKKFFTTLAKKTLAIKQADLASKRDE